MIDRIDVIKGLQNCLDCNCDDCTQEDASGYPWDCTAYYDLICHALQLLKEQEPRVLTLEEVMQYIGYSEKIPPKEWAKLPLWTESREGTGVISGYRDVENLRNLIDMDGIDGTYIAYKHWRCWSSRPTDEQREAVPWTE